MLTFMQHQVHFMLDYKRGQCMPVDHAHLVLWKWLWIIWLGSSAVEGVLSQSICPKSKREMSVPSCSLKFLHVCTGRQPLHRQLCVHSLYIYQGDMERL